MNLLFEIEDIENGFQNLNDMYGLANFMKSRRKMFRCLTFLISPFLQAGTHFFQPVNS